MALKGDRTESIQEIAFYMNETATRGGVVVMSTAGSGSALDNSSNLVTYTYTSGCYPMGILIQDMVDVDQTKYHINPYKDEAQKGSKVRVLRQGWVVTNMIYPGQTPTVGALGYTSASGYIASTKIWGDASQQAVGRFESTTDEDGYAKFYVNCPNIG